jgi:hypothetical protein
MRRYPSLIVPAVLMAAILSSCAGMTLVTKRDLRTSGIATALAGKKLGVLPVKVSLVAVRRETPIINISIGGAKFKANDPTIGNVEIWNPSLWKGSGADAKALSAEATALVVKRLTSDEIFWVQTGQNGAFVLATGEVELSQGKNVAPDVKPVAGAKALPASFASVKPIGEKDLATVDVALQIVINLGCDAVKKIDDSEVKDLPFGARKPVSGDLYVMRDYDVTYSFVDAKTKKTLYAENKADPILMTLKGVRYTFAGDKVNDKNLNELVQALGIDYAREAKELLGQAIDGIIPGFRPVYSHVQVYEKKKEE